MSFPAYLREILLEKILDSAEPHGSITLREKRVREKRDMIVELSGLPADAIAIRLDRTGFSGIKDGPWKMCCDYLVIFQDGDTVQALFVELKQTLSKSYAYEQLRRSQPWLKCLRSVCEIESGSNFPEPQVRYAVIVLKLNSRFDKQRTKQGGPAETWSHSGIQGTLSIGATNVRFSQLWGQ